MKKENEMTRGSRYLIVASGVLHGSTKLKDLIDRADVVVCADGGAEHLVRLGHFPDLLMGDLDSITSHHLELFQKQRVPLIRHPRKKDATDTALAVDWAIEKGATEIVLTAVTGTRLDHTLANILLLKSIHERGVDAWIVDDHNEIYLLSHMDPLNPVHGYYDKQEVAMEITGHPGELLSVVPLSETVKGVTLKGLAYPLHDAELTLGSSIGISNVFTENTARISLREGTVLITKSKDA